MPHALDAEVAILGGVLADPEALHEIVDIVEAADFYVIIYLTRDMFCVILLIWLIYQPFLMASPSRH